MDLVDHTADQLCALLPLALQTHSGCARERVALLHRPCTPGHANGEFLMARVAITSLESDESKGLNERDDATDFIDKILDQVLGQDRHEWTSAYEWDDALADVGVRMVALKSCKCLHQIAESVAQGMDAQNLW